MMAAGRGKIVAIMFGLALWDVILPSAVRAEGGPHPEDPSYLAAGLGVYDVFHQFTTAQARLEYRFGQRFLYFLKPVVGGLVTAKGSAMGYGGFRIDLYLGRRWVVTPNAAVGAWTRGGGKDLGSTIEFKTGAEVAYRFDDRGRLGLAFDHISNAGIGKRNPGTESVLLLYSFPLGPPVSN